MVCLAWATPDPASSKVLLTVREALELAFPGCKIERTTVFLTQAQKKRAAELARAKVPRSIVYPYRCERGGTAYFDTHRVRTLEETIMVAIEDGRIVRIEVLAFREPLDYVPGERWYGQFLQVPLQDDLELGRQIHPVAGATLTARATTDAARRVLAIHHAIAESGGAP